MDKFHQLPITTRVGRVNAGTSPFEIRKIVVENWYSLQEIYRFGEKAEIQEIFSKKWGEVNFPIFSQKFSYNIAKPFHFWSQRAKFCTRGSFFSVPD